MSFLHNLRQKPEHHRKRFALLASTTVTLFIFGFWSLATFGANGLVLPNGEANVATVSSAGQESEVSPFGSLRMNMAGAFLSLQQSVVELKNLLGTIDLVNQYERMRDNAIEVYGR